MLSLTALEFELGDAVLANLLDGDAVEDFKVRLVDDGQEELRSVGIKPTGENLKLWILSQMMHDKKRTQENGQFSIADASKKCRSCDLPS